MMRFMTDTARNIALTKAGFATCVSQGKPPFDTLNFEHFRGVFCTIDDIVSGSIPRWNVYCPEWDVLLAEINAVVPARQVRLIFDRIRDVFVMALQIFSICTIRVYEAAIINEPADQRKRVVPIKKIVTEAFRQPGLATFAQLAEKCSLPHRRWGTRGAESHEEVPRTVSSIGSLGQLWDDLEILTAARNGCFQNHQ